MDAIREAKHSHYYEVQIECYNASGKIYFSENYRYSRRYSALQKLTALKRHHPSSEVVLIKKQWETEKRDGSEDYASKTENEGVGPLLPRGREQNAR